MESVDLKGDGRLLLLVVMVRLPKNGEVLHSVDTVIIGRSVSMTHFKGTMTFSITSMITTSITLIILTIYTVKVKNIWTQMLRSKEKANIIKTKKMERLNNNNNMVIISKGINGLNINKKTIIRMLLRKRNWM